MTLYLDGITQNSAITTISVTMKTGSTRATALHNMGKLPNIIGRPNPDKLAEGIDAIVSVDIINVTIDISAPVSTDTIFKVGLV